MPRLDGNNLFQLMEVYLEHEYRRNKMFLELIVLLVLWVATAKEMKYPTFSFWFSFFSHLWWRTCCSLDEHQCRWLLAVGLFYEPWFRFVEVWYLFFFSFLLFCFVFLSSFLLLCCSIFYIIDGSVNQLSKILHGTICISIKCMRNCREYI